MHKGEQCVVHYFDTNGLYCLWCGADRPLKVKKSSKKKRNKPNIGWRRRAEVFRVYGRACWYCEATPKDLTIDHYVPWSEGGTNRLSNLRPACRSCNEEKANMMPEAWDEALERKGLPPARKPPNEVMPFPRLPPPPEGVG